MRRSRPPLFSGKKPCYNAYMPDFRILGPLEASDETGPLLLGGQKQRAVLAVLLLEAGRVVSTDRLVDALWGEEPPRTASTSLQNFVSLLRKSLGAGVLETKPPGYRLNLRPGELDSGRWSRRRRLAGRRKGRRSCGKLSPCGGALLSPTSPSKRSPNRRSSTWRSFDWRHWRSGSRRTSRLHDTASSWASSRRLSSNIQFGSDFAASTC
jgi:hypothetical protein